MRNNRALSRENALELLREYNTEPFHIKHALKLEGVMRPSGSLFDLETKSVKKKFKTKSFAAGCSREVIERGAGRLGLGVDELIGETIEAMRGLGDSI